MYYYQKLKVISQNFVTILVYLKVNIQFIKNNHKNIMIDMLLTHLKSTNIQINVKL